MDTSPRRRAVSNVVRWTGLPDDHLDGFSRDLVHMHVWSVQQDGGRTYGKEPEMTRVTHTVTLEVIEFTGTRKKKGLANTVANKLSPLLRVAHRV